MKKIFLLSLFICFLGPLFSQDIIVTMNNDTIEAKVLTVYDAVIKYVLFNNQDGAAQFIAKAKIKTVAYENGSVENYEKANINAAQSNIIINNNANPKKQDEKIFHNILKIKPLATILAAFLGFFEVDIQYARYLTPKLAIPVEVDIFAALGFGMGFGVLTGIEAVPATHRQKSGFYLNALAGFIAFDGVGFIANPNAGYQLVTKGGFVFSATIGAMYSGLTNAITPRISLDFGFAF